MLLIKIKHSRKLNILFLKGVELRVRRIDVPESASDGSREGCEGIRRFVE